MSLLKNLDCCYKWFDKGSLNIRHPAIIKYADDTPPHLCFSYSWGLFPDTWQM